MKYRKFIAAICASTLLMGNVVSASGAVQETEIEEYSYETQSINESDLQTDELVLTGDAEVEVQTNMSDDDGIVDEEDRETDVNKEDIEVTTEGEEITESQGANQSITNWDYRVDGSYITIIEYTGSASNVTIPDNIEGYPVRKINYDAFKNNRIISTVTIPEGVTDIADGAFAGSSLSTLNYNAVNCNSMYGSRVFENCINFKSLNIGDGVESLPASAFVGTAITNVSIPNSITEIPDYGFKNCKSLTSVDVGKNNLYIRYEAFSGCTGLKRLKLGDKTKELGTSSFFDCIALTEVTIPQNVTTIRNYSFEGCTSLTTLNYNAINCSTQDGLRVFKNCTSFKNLNLGKQVESLPESAFAGTAITGFTIPNTMKRISSSAFADCKGLRSINTGTNIQYINSYAFKNCTNLTEVNFGSKTQEIGYEAFKNCIALSEISLPSKIISIGNYAFADCIGLKTLKYNPMNCNSMYAPTVFQNCMDLENVTIGSKVQSLPSSAFEGLNLKKAVLPSTVKSIPSYAFRNCKKLSSVSIGGAKSIDYRAFSGCTKLSKLVVGRGVTTISYDAFFETGSNFTINCYYGSVAHKYAKDYKIRYSLLARVPGSFKAVGQNRAVKLTWKKLPEAKGYEIYGAASKSGKYTRKATLAGASRTSYTQKKLVKGRSYYYKIRSYRIVGGKKIYSSFSSVKYAKVK